MLKKCLLVILLLPALVLAKDGDVDYEGVIASITSTTVTLESGISGTLTGQTDYEDDNGNNISPSLAIQDMT